MLLHVQLRLAVDGVAEGELHHVLTHGLDLAAHRGNDALRQMHRAEHVIDHRVGAVLGHGLQELGQMAHHIDDLIRDAAGDAGGALELLGRAFLAQALEQRRAGFDHLLDLLEHVLAHLGQLLQNDGVDLALLGGGGGQRAETCGKRGDERGGAAVFGLSGGVGNGLDIFLQRLIAQTLELDGDFLFFCHNGFLQI